MVGGALHSEEFATLVATVVWLGHDATADHAQIRRRRPHEDPIVPAKLGKHGRVPVHRTSNGENATQIMARSSNLDDPGIHLVWPHGCSTDATLPSVPVRPALIPPPAPLPRARW